MIKNVAIDLAGPICQCPEPDLQIKFSPVDERLIICCDRCEYDHSFPIVGLTTTVSWPAAGNTKAKAANIQED